MADQIETERLGEVVGSNEDYELRGRYQMRRSSDAKGTAVELMNCPVYRQGSFDSLCAYYTGAMMLATLFPEFAASFGTAVGQRTTKYVAEDPLIRLYGNEDHRKVLTRWFFNGEYIKKVVNILNKTMESGGEATSFQYLEMDRRKERFEQVIVPRIEEGLPVMLGWNTKDYGCHAVLVTGYWIGKERWLTINDPGGATEQVSWNSLRDHQKHRGKFEVGLCNKHLGPRPMQVRTTDNVPVVYQWMPDQQYRPIKCLFNSIAVPQSGRKVTA